MIGRRRSVLVAVVVAFAISISIIIIASSSSSSISPTSFRRQQQRRSLWPSSTSFNDPKTVEYKSDIIKTPVIRSNNYNLVHAQQHPAVPPDVVTDNNAMMIRSYDVYDAIKSTELFRYTYFFFVYDSINDIFHVVHNIPKCDHGCARIHRLATTLSYALRKHFPQRIQQSDTNSNDLVLMLSCGDAPRIKAVCLSSPTNCNDGASVPVLQFGSIFIDSTILANSMIAMPLPVRPHMPCFDEWQVSDGTSLCQDLLPAAAAITTTSHTNAGADLMAVDHLRNDVKGGLPYGVELGIIPSSQIQQQEQQKSSHDYWDTLIQQVIWRGTDFQYLHTMYPKMRPPMYEYDIMPYEKARNTPFANDYNTKRWAIDTLWAMGNEELLLPRWRGVLLTSEAELETGRMSMLEKNSNGRQQSSVLLPWINIKFANVATLGTKIPASEYAEYHTLQEYGISAIGDYISMTEQAKYKYHIDLGGGGGTTWTGTIEKLAMPGLLFHHVTPTKDYFHDLLVPWEHYVPIKDDLSDLREKYDWAESHPIEAKEIAENGTRFARWMGSPDGFGKLYDEFIISPLQKVIMAYIPTAPKQRGKTTLDVILESGNGQFTVVSRCTGLHGTSCIEVGQ